MGGSNSTRNPENEVPFQRNKNCERDKDLVDLTYSGKGTMEGPGETVDWMNDINLSGTMERQGETYNWLNQSMEGSVKNRYLDSQLLTYVRDIENSDGFTYDSFWKQHARIKELLKEAREKENKRLKEQAEKIKAETKELSQKPESDPQVVETAEFFTKMTEEILDQKDRLTKSNLNDRGKRSTPQNRRGGVFERLRRNNSADQSLETIESKHKLRTERATKEIMEDCAQHRKYHDLLKGEYHTGVSADQFIQTIITCHPEFANNSASINDVCCDVKKYIHQISRLVQEKICSLREEVRKKLEYLMMSFQRLIAGMWKLLLYDLLLYEMTSLFATYQREESNISRKKGRFKYGFQMASMMALWLAHDVESNPGPSFSIRSSLERIARDLSEVLKSQLPVDGSLWSKSVAAAAYAAGYSTDFQWSNPSGNTKDNLRTLIERGTELGRVLTTLDCLPPEYAPFVNDLGNYVKQEQLAIHYKVKNLKSAVDIVLGIRSLGDEDKQAIVHEIQRLKQIPNSFKRPVDSGRMFNLADFDQLADSSTSHPTSRYQKKTMRRKPKRVRHRKENGNHLDNLDKSQNSAVPEKEAAVTLGQQMDPGADGENETSIVLNLDETSLAVSKVQDVSVQEDMTIKSLYARNTDRTSTSDETQTFSVGTKESEPFGSTGEAILMDEIFDSKILINQSLDIELDDILTWLEVQNVMDDDARSTDMPRTATNSPGMKQLKKADGNLKDSDSTLQENAGEGNTINHQEKEEADEQRREDDDSIEHFVQGEQISKTESETEFLQQTISPLATGSNICHEAVRDEVMSVDGRRRKGAEGDTCENEAETLSSGEEQFAAAETETEPIQQTVSPLAAVTQSYPDTDRDEMCREETVDDNTSGTRENEAEDLTLGTEQFAGTEPADKGKQRMEPTADEHFAKFKAALLEEVDARLEAFKATLANNTPNEQFVLNENGDPLDCASSDVEHTEPRVRSSDTSRKRNLTDPENGPTSKKWRQ